MGFGTSAFTWWVGRSKWDPVAAIPAASPKVSPKWRNLLAVGRSRVRAAVPTQGVLRVGSGWDLAWFCNHDFEAFSGRLAIITRGISMVNM